MARTSERDPLDKFRFKVTILEPAQTISFNKLTGPDTVDSVNRTSNISPNGGFSEVVLPKVTINEIQYRENIHGTSSIKKPGLANYEPITLRKGAFIDTNLYDWLSKVHDSTVNINAYLSSLSSLAVMPIQNTQYRRDLFISVMDRSGEFVKHWYVYEAFPTGYSPGDSLSASEDAKLVNELTLAYEGFVEVQGKTISEALHNVQSKSFNNLKKAVGSAVRGAAIGALGL